MVSVEVIGMDHVFVEGDMMRNEDWLVLKIDMSDRSLLVDLWIINQ